MGRTNKILHSNIKEEDNKTILALAEILKEKEKDKLSTEALFHQPETLIIIKMILTKYEKDETDIYVLTKYLSNLKSFMQTIMQGQPEDFNMIPLLKKISYNLECEEYYKNTFVMKVGEEGKDFYVILSGTVSVLVPKVISIIMTEKQYLKHLKKLHYYKEKHLLERTYFNNCLLYPNIKLDQITKEDIKKKKKKKHKEEEDYHNNIYINNNNEEEEEKYLDFESEDFTLEKYISEINASDIKEEKYESIEVKIVGYYKVIDLNQGSSFGEIALINENQQRTASIFVKEESIFGILSTESYKKSLKSIQEINKKKDIEFIFKTKLFNDMSIYFFTQNYWNYFTHTKMVFGDVLFNQNDERKEIYFIQDGEFKLTSYQLSHKKINLIINQLGNINFEKNDYADIGKSIDLPLSYAKKGDILGTGDIIYDNKFFCNAICTSKKSAFFSINYNIFENICKIYKGVLNNWRKLETDKKILMIQKFQNVKFTNKNSLSGEYRKEDENAVFWKGKKNDEDLNEENLIQKKYNRMQRFNTIVSNIDSSLLINRNLDVEKKKNRCFYFK